MPSGGSKGKFRTSSWFVTSDQRPKVRRPDGDWAAAPVSVAPGSDNGVPENAYSRCKKPPRSGRISNVGAENLGFSSMATLAAVIMEASASGSAVSQPDLKADRQAAEAWPLAAATCSAKANSGDDHESLPDGDEFRDDIIPELQGTKAPINDHNACPKSIYSEGGLPQVSDRTKFPEDEAFQPSPTPKIKNEKETNPLDATRRKWYLTLTRLLIFVVFIIISSRKIAIGISIFAVAALLFEAIFKSFLPLPSTPEETEKSAGIAGIATKLVAEPPVLIIGKNITGGGESPNKSEPDLASELSWDAAAQFQPLLPTESPTISLAEEDCTEGDGGQRLGKLPRRSSARTKNLLRKLVRRSSGASSVDTEE